MPIANAATSRARSSFCARASISNMHDQLSLSSRSRCFCTYPVVSTKPKALPISGHTSATSASGTGARPRRADEVAWKAPAVSHGVDTAVTCGSFETGRVLRARFPVDFKLLPHFHPDEWRTAVVLSGNYYFGPRLGFVSQQVSGRARARCGSARTQMSRHPAGSRSLLGRGA